MGRDSWGDRSHSVCAVVNSHPPHVARSCWVPAAGAGTVTPQPRVIPDMPCVGQVLSNTREQSPTPPLASEVLESFCRFIPISKSGAHALCLAIQEEFSPWLMGLSQFSFLMVLVKSYQITAANT